MSEISQPAAAVAKLIVEKTLGDTLTRLHDLAKQVAVVDGRTSLMDL